jgi:hypothetical protein
MAFHSPERETAMKTIRKSAALALLLTLALGAVPGHAGLLDKAKSFLNEKESAPASSAKPANPNLSNDEIAGGLKEALTAGADRVVATLGKTDGFEKSPDVHIPLPGALKTAQTALKAVGASQLGDDLELRLNRAAEAAVPQAKGLFVDAISRMSIDDARQILSGPDDAATHYFKGKMEAPLARQMTPIVGSELSEAGAVKAYDTMIDRYKDIPLVPDIKTDLTGYVVDKAIDGVFLYLGREEAAIRKDPARQTTALLKKVFGG